MGRSNAYLRMYKRVPNDVCVCVCVAGTQSNTGCSDACSDASSAVARGKVHTYSEPSARCRWLALVLNLEAAIE